MKIISSLFLLSICSCTIHKNINGQQVKQLLQQSAIATGETGICIYDPSTKKYLYQYQADKYFTPASNVKLFTLYAGLKYLGDSLPGLNIVEAVDSIVLFPTGDPTLLHPYFNSQPVFDFLSTTSKKIIAPKQVFSTTAYGKGWSWDDYNESFMNERSALPVYGNNIILSGIKNHMEFYPKAAEKLFHYSFFETLAKGAFLKEVKRDFYSNRYTCYFNDSKNSNRVVPFITSDSLAYLFIEDSLGKKIYYNWPEPLQYDSSKVYTIYSRPVDSLFIPMMYDSDNFFAEQTLLMVNHKRWNAFNEAQIIDSLLQTDFKDIPQKPQWVDGSGLSRYNLFTPQSFVYLLNKMMNEFGLERMKKLLPTGGQGTLKNYFTEDAGYLFAKTGTLSNISSLSGYLITRKNKLLIFSILNNNYMGKATPVKRAVELFLHQIRMRY